MCVGVGDSPSSAVKPRTEAPSKRRETTWLLAVAIVSENTFCLAGYSHLTIVQFIAQSRCGVSATSSSLNNNHGQRALIGRDVCKNPSKTHR